MKILSGQKLINAIKNGFIFPPMNLVKYQTKDREYVLINEFLLDFPYILEKVIEEKLYFTSEEPKFLPIDKSVLFFAIDNGIYFDLKKHFSWIGSSKEGITIDTLNYINNDIDIFENMEDVNVLKDKVYALTEKYDAYQTKNNTLCLIELWKKGVIDHAQDNSLKEFPSIFISLFFETLYNGGYPKKIVSFISKFDIKEAKFFLEQMVNECSNVSATKLAYNILQKHKMVEKSDSTLIPVAPTMSFENNLFVGEVNLSKSYLMERTNFNNKFRENIMDFMLAVVTDKFISEVISFKHSTYNFGVKTLKEGSVEQVFDYLKNGTDFLLSAQCKHFTNGVKSLIEIESVETIKQFQKEFESHILYNKLNNELETKMVSKNKNKI